MLLSGLITLMLTVLFYTRWRFCMKYHILSKHAYRMLKEQFSYLGYHYQIFQHIALILLVMAVVFCFFQLFSLRLVYQMPLYLITVFLLPDMLFCILAQRMEEQRFRDMTLFLQHLIALFRQYQKVYQAMRECGAYVSIDFQKRIAQCVAAIDRGCSLQDACMLLYEDHPHFIIHHTFMCMETLEAQGGDLKEQGLDLILEDIDDWIEDTYAYKQEQLSSKNRILILCVMSAVIAFLAKNMLRQLETELVGEWYQYAMVFFFICLLLTLWNAHRILKKTWIDEKECIWLK